MPSTLTIVSFLVETLLFPALIGAALTYLTLYLSRPSAFNNRSTPRAVESDLHNEHLDSELERYTPWLFFALYFNIAFLTANVALDIGKGSLLTTVYSTAVVCFLIALFVTLVFELRFKSWRYVAIGLAFSVFGTVVIFSAIQFGFAMGTAVGTAAGTGLATRGTAIAVPLSLASGAWCLAAIAFLLASKGDRIVLPLRLPNSQSYNLFLGALVIGWVGVCLALIHSLLQF